MTGSIGDMGFGSPRLLFEPRSDEAENWHPVVLWIPVNPASQKAAMDLHGAWSYRLPLRNAGGGWVRNH